MTSLVAVGAARATAPINDGARALFWRLFWIYQGGCAVAVAVTLLLVLLGLELNARQWLIILAVMPPAIGTYNVIDVLVIRRHVAPIQRALRELDAGPAAPSEVLGPALVRALNLPFYSFMRVTFLHGPLVMAVICGFLEAANLLLAADYQAWQVLAFAATAMFFASPTHAIFEYFAVSRAMVPLIRRIGRAMGGVLPADDQRKLVSIPLKSKLLYLAVFVAALPLLFFAASIVFKVERLLLAQGVRPDAAIMIPFYLWIAGVVAVCMLGSVMMALLTAREVSRNATQLIEGMRLVERGRLDDIALEVVSTDEYADIFRGFHHMLDALREEQRILAVSHDLAGELQLDLLIARIMRATTELLNAERSTLFVHDPKTGELFSVFAEGDELREIRLPANRGIAGAVFTSGQPENIDDPYADPRFDSEIDRQTGFTTRSILCHPIVNKHGGRIGVTQVLNKRGGSFGARDEARLRAFSAQIAVCLENARLFDDVLSMKNYNESILKSTSNGVVTFDAEHRIVTANEAALALLDRVQLAGLPAREVFGGSNGWIADRLEHDELAREAQLAVDAEIARAGKPPASVNLTAAPLIDAADQRIGSMLVMEDITAEKRVRTTMARYMSKEVADQLLKDGEDALVGKDQTVSILFSDVRGFTSIAETIGARQTVAMLNDYFTEMVDVVFAHHGILDKYIGDAIMALFGAPFIGPTDADNALRTANQMLLSLARLNARRADGGHKPLEIGLGISTGDVIVGNIGSSKRMEYTVIGDSVNLASRLEGANKFYGTRILLSEFTRRRLTAPALTREIDLIRVKGKDFPVAVHEGLDHRAADPTLPALLDHYAAGLAAYRKRDWSGAHAGFERALASAPGDGPSAMYLDRCRRFADAPPPPDWDAVWTLSSK